MGRSVNEVKCPWGKKVLTPSLDAGGAMHKNLVHLLGGHAGTIGVSHSVISTI